MRIIKRIAWASLALLAVVGVMCLFVPNFAFQLRGFLAGQARYGGHPSCYWKYQIDPLAEPFGHLTARRTLSAGGAEAVPVLLEIMRDTDSAVRWDAVDILGKIGPDAKAAVPDLVAIIKSDDDGFDGLGRLTAWAALRKIDMVTAARIQPPPPVEVNRFRP